MSCIDDEKLNLKILVLISAHSVFTISEVEYAYNKLRSYDLVIEAVDFATTNNLKLSNVAQDIKMIKKNTEEETIRNIISKENNYENRSD